ncbi:gamma-glutamyltransferase [Candidatus Bipolaricaulota bacterium]|nr:gamma-glutamyltransferase [Candidatus Bipolaricaulota bacterium]
MVVAAHPQAAQAGAQILAEGGNAIDAAIATAFALAVVEPEASGLGGGGFLLSYDSSTQSCISMDYRETAPSQSTDAMFSLTGPGLPDRWNAPQTEAQRDALTKYGGQAVGVPRMVAGLLRAHELYGRLPLADVLEPAIRLAEDGFTVSDAFYSAVLNIYDVLIADDAMAAAFLNDYLPYEPGETARRPDLAATFRRIESLGVDEFYRGDMAADIVRAVQDAGGILNLQDMRDVDVVVSEPIATTYRDVRLVAPPLPAGSITVFEILGILEGYELGVQTGLTADSVHLIAEAAKRAFADRAAFVGDPLSTDVPFEMLLSPQWTAMRRDSIDIHQATPFPDAGVLESSSTTHISVIDAEGNAVSLTQSISLFFGSRVFVPEWGILMNNTMADFDPEPGGPNSVAAGKIPASSMCPLFVFESDRLRAVLGTPGGMRIASTLVELVVQLVDWNIPLSVAISAPRFHSETDTLYVEARVPDNVISGLEARGHRIEVKSPFDLFFGGAHVIEILGDGTDAVYVGVADPRRAGQAAGL